MEWSDIKEKLTPKKRQKMLLICYKSAMDMGDMV